jgi:large subunit ribosomal protein L24
MNTSTSKHNMSSPLSEELFQAHGVGQMDVRKGDTVTVTRGSFRGVEGKVSSVDTRKGRIFVEGVSREKADGAARLIPIHASKVALRQLVLDDKRRKDIIERRANGEVKEKPKRELGVRRSETKDEKNEPSKEG